MSEEEDANDYISQQIQGLSNDNTTLQLENQELRNNSKFGNLSMFGGEDPTNMIEAQLNLKEELDRIEHLLRGHIVEYDKEGNITYKNPPDPEMIPLNDYGVNLIMQVISFYINKNTILSNYDTMWIDLKMQDFSYELAELFEFKYYQMGMDTDSKRQLFPMIHRALTDSVHSTYLRALGGMERDSIRKSFFVNQNQAGQAMNHYPTQQVPQQQRRRSLLNPASWMRS